MKTARRRCLQGVLHNVVDTLASRNSDFEGYWFPGFLVSDSGFSINLLEENEPSGANPRAAFERFARHRFLELLHKARLDEARVRSASLHFGRSDVQQEGTVNGHVTQGYDVALTASAVTERIGLRSSLHKYMLKSSAATGHRIPVLGRAA